MNSNDQKYRTKKLSKSHFENRFFDVFEPFLADLALDLLKSANIKRQNHCFHNRLQTELSELL
jgi:hypothetical protein